ncbi:amidase family protein [Stylonychia lemnae]|uniref:Amidase family protein n=1 Tax=Stylonychia lemnae TaxID=5949 RepID=A0A078A172_STYLE|nr:amidase family protein [Stylonychia lemnae]|eukprot:CDW76001.1 amidase family protein [Stylonychia lemnae]
MHKINLHSMKEKINLRHVAYGIGALIVYKLINYMIWKTKNSRLNARSAQIVAERDSKTYNFIEVSPEKTQLILGLPDIREIRKNLFKRSFTISELVTVYSKRTVDIGRKLNLTMVELIDEALDTAKEYDLILEMKLKDGQQDQLPPLFGIPVSFKENVKLPKISLNLFQISTKGDRNSRGAQIYQECIADEDAVTVKLFKKAGAIIIVKASMAQCGFSLHNSNNIIGTARNPYNQARTCGGSSGGDSALVAARCVPLAVGTDIGGSLRVPATFHGLFSFKPTGGRTSIKGQMSGFPKMSTFTTVLPSQGPIARSHDDLVLATRLQLDPEIHTYDWKIPPSPFREDEYLRAVNGGKQKLRVGYMDRLPTLQSSKAARRALQLAKDALESQGFELVPFNLTLEEVRTLKQTLSGIMITSNAGPICQLVTESGENLQKVNLGFFAYYKANSIKQFLIRTLLNLTGNHRIATSLAGFKNLSKEELDDYIRVREQLNEDIRSRFKDMDIIGLILPIYPHCAFKDSNQVIMNSLLEYTSIWNALMYPCGSVPTTLVEETETNPLDYQDYADDMITKTVRQDIEGSEGMPMGVQVVGLSQMDETVLGLMKAIDNGIEFRSRPKDF